VLDSLGLSTSQMESICHRNAERMFGISTK
jgi:hypothetical protein